MYRAALRASSQQARASLCHHTCRTTNRRLASSIAASRPRSWKGSALRWGLAAGAVYYYNTSSVFAEEVAAAEPISAPSSFAESDLPTVDSVIEQKRVQLRDRSDQDAKADEKQSTGDTAAGSSPPPSESHATAAAESPEALEEEAGQEGAFNPETGEINWDCPCLGGMASGPCGEEFKTAFSCFVHSSEEPKGMDCIDKFQGMQNCFRQYPDIYGAELDDDENGEDPGSTEGQSVPQEEQGGPTHRVEQSNEANSAVANTVEDSGVPKKWEDATEANTRDAKDEQPAKKAAEEKKD